MATQHARMKILSIFGTRPEAIKMAPLVRALAAEPGIDSRICITGQHQSMLQQVLDMFELKADYSLDVMRPHQTLNSLTAALYAAIDPILDEMKPDKVLVHGDTTSAMVAAMSAFHRQIPIGHVEAGLRTGDIRQPWPEEMNRRCIDLISDHLFTPTAESRRNVLGERLQGVSFVTGNTVIDALQMTAQRIDSNRQLRHALDRQFSFLVPERKVLVVTGHRRENFGDGFLNICKALRALAMRDDIQIVYPVHLNPNVLGPVTEHLGDMPNVHLINPLDYLSFVRLMQRAHVILTDSGGVQEEAPSLGKPVLVMRDVTERPEAVAAGTVRLVGTEAEAIIQGVSALFDDEQLWQNASHAANPYGDGKASARIVDVLMGRPINEFVVELPRRRPEQIEMVPPSLSQPEPLRAMAR
ncbi:UDP-N-acetylglucosamine 2-epimerase (non-hydrolyzing) [Pseudomonas viridiflava]|uniref:UDP-N-acetylglucosamine 2-epimerase (non-hydrolyzing) n=1 Tax=Pseudomonas viridiflava TaxID=33069 RepID=A0ABU7NBY7_PSEVI|nr:UDP-N-acetylglucosamine 2-epimerase (non-hydrolyzing) [Pseudomonas viridiflava]MEE3936490.1 UDP-N-acetylglucosamine 2-epimerase (non-hydrolyzing) [Pseudomonas viridiflava]MEE4042455.1 UDP-N-acetylglucosamine 2-epimerase (non-hydrolyzing) [Pseudomonas viridiflava]MEE4060281.1 UDP-N-acetylglucosamine 2-epimerase (non-hydrolyzing) [Pseudomonas viridiflava]MEE4169958.1 UDP-N-acetylglucosamine 2-epimerase (non-hydrolyzing) [Pseudomonas viridiflava]